MGEDQSKTIEFPVSLTVRDLALKMDASPIQVIKVSDVQWCDGKHQPDGRL